MFKFLKAVNCTQIIRGRDTHGHTDTAFYGLGLKIHNLGHSVSGISFSRWFLKVDQNTDLSAERNLKS